MLNRCDKVSHLCRAVIKAHLVSHLFTQPDTHLLRHPLGYSDGCNPPGLSYTNSSMPGKVWRDKKGGWGRQDMVCTKMNDTCMSECLWSCGWYRYLLYISTAVVEWSSRCQFHRLRPGMCFPLRPERVCLCAGKWEGFLIRVLLIFFSSLMLTCLCPFRCVHALPNLTFKTSSD